MPAAFRRDLGPWSPWGRVQRYRRRYNEIIAELISEARNDPAFEERNDVLALMLQARYEDGSPISDDHIADELLTLLAAGHETTATTLAWAIERLRTASAPAVPARRGGRRGWIGAAAGHDLGSSAHPPGGGGHRHGPHVSESGWASGSSRRTMPSSRASRCRTNPSRTSRTRSRSTPTASSAATRTPTPGFRTAEASAGASAPSFANMEMNVTLRTVAARIRVRHNLCRRRAHPLARRGHCTRHAAAAPLSTDERRDRNQRLSADPSGCRRDTGADSRRRRPRYRAVLRTIGDPERSSDRAHRRAGTTAARLVAERLRDRAGRTRLLRHPLRQSRRRPVHPPGLSAAQAARNSARRQPSAPVPPR